MEIKTRNGLHLFPLNTYTYHASKNQKVTIKKKSSNYITKKLNDSWNSLGWIKGKEEENRGSVILIMEVCQ